MNMRWILLLPVLFFAVEFSAAGENKWDEDLRELQDDYAAAVERAMKPLRARHIDELERLQRHATQAGELDAAVKIRKELERMQAKVGGADNPFVGQWEYRSGSNTYRRIVRKDGAVDLWKNGKPWLKDDGKPWWQDHTWKLTGGKLELRKADRSVVATWEIKEGDPDTVLQDDPGTGKLEMLKRSSRPWK